MSFFIKEENVRPGNRGGRTLFNWNDIRLLNNKERESYLGVTQSIGFLDKGGKWRKRDWWQSKDNNSKYEIDQNQILSERERIKQEEQRLFNETFNNINGNSSNNLPNNSTNKSGINASNQKKEKLTVFEWKELMKKEANINMNDPKIFEFYENDEHKRGLGMKPNISFRTNPYEKDTMQKIKRLDGEGFEEENIEKAEDLNNLRKNSNDKSSESGKEISKKNKKAKREKEKEFPNSKNKNLSKDLIERQAHLGGKSYAEIMEIWEKEQQDKKRYLEKAGKSVKDLTKEKSKKDKKSRKDKKEKKNKKRNDKYRSESEGESDRSKDRKNKKRNRSYSRSRSKSRSNSRRRHKD